MRCCRSPKWGYNLLSLQSSLKNDMIYSRIIDYGEVFVKNKNAYIKTAFTLAEVLITLAIIGIVAALTIPALINTINDAQYKTAYKKAYSMICQAFLQASNDNAISPLTGSNSSTGSEANFAVIKKYFEIARDCNNSNLSDCWDITGEAFRNNDGISTNIPAFVDKSGMSWKLKSFDAANNAPGVAVDTNGLKGPNKYGQDRFPFFYANANMSPNGNNWYNAAGMGMPTKIISMKDILVLSDDDVAPKSCISVSAHPCYYSSWLSN